MIFLKHGLGTAIPGLLILTWMLSFRLAAQSNPPGDIRNNPILGVHKLLFIRVKYPDDDAVVLTDARAIPHARDLEEIIERNGYGTVDLQIDITPLLTMPQPKSYYRNGPVFVRIRADAIQLAAAAGYAEKDYDREVIFTTKIWPQLWYGYGFPNWRTSFMAADSPLLSAHEVGHSFGWLHATFWRVEGDDPISPEGTQLSYGDGFDIMGDQVGKARTFHHFNPWFKSRVGWIPPENILTVTASGTYTIRAIEAAPLPGAPDSAFHALKIHKDPQTDYWVFYRSQEKLANAGAMIVRVRTTNFSPSQLLDMTPASKPLREDYEDAALTLGNIFSDPEAGIQIKLVEKTADSLRVAVFVPQTPVDTLPVLDVIRPARGETVRGVVDYEVTAFDPDAGNSNGAGIDSVKIILGKFSGEDSVIAFASAELATPPYVLHVDTDSIPDMNGSLFVTAIGVDGRTNTSHFPHIIDNTGPSVPTSVEGEPSKIPETFHLLQNYPNPFNPETTIAFILPAPEHVRLQVFDLRGREVVTLVNGPTTAGEHTVSFNAANLPGGVYMIRMQAGEFNQVRKAILLK